MVKDEMYRERFKDGKSPFQEEINSELFFSGGGRKSIRDEIIDAISGNVTVITLLGEEGDGKSHLCQLTFMKIEETVFPVYLPDPLESYEDVIRIVAQELNLSLRDQDQLGGTSNLLEAIWGRLDVEGKRLLLIFDQAEQIYLATLERIRKMVDHSNKDRVRLQILLAGRSALKDNLQQLAMCSFEGGEEKHFHLEPLSNEETYDYLNFCMQFGQGYEEKEVFTREAAEKIFSIAHGNFRMTNILADESLQTLSTETSFMVLLDNVRDSEETDPIKKRESRISVSTIKDELPKLIAELKEKVIGMAAVIRRRMPVSFNDVLEQKEWAIGAGGGAIAILIVLFLLFNGTDEEEFENKVTDASSVNIEYKEVGTQPAKKTLVNNTPLLKEKQVLPKEINEKERVATVVEDTKGTTKEPGVIEVKNTEPVDKREEVVIVAQPKDTAPGGSADSTPEEKPEKIVEGHIGKARVDTITDSTSQKPEPELLPEKMEVNKPVVSIPMEDQKKIGATIRVEPLEALPRQVLNPPVLGGQGAVGKKVARITDSKDSANIIYNRRVVASAKWWVGEQEGKYTVQLMALTSDKAEDNLKKMLMEKEYQDVAEELYILRKKTSPLTVLVFFGEYKTMDEARKAKVNLPEFLRKEHPYALSIAGAVNKAGSG